jgi:uncharacterized membrane protein YeaQ/YmgE (transglycosylase-associated protein family)
MEWGEGPYWGVGIVEAFRGSFLMNLFGVAGVTGFNFYSLLAAILGAVVLLFLVRTAAPCLNQTGFD